MLIKWRGLLIVHFVDLSKKSTCGDNPWCLNHCHGVCRWQVFGADLWKLFNSWSSCVSANLFRRQSFLVCGSVFHARLPDGTNIFKPKIPILVNFGGSCSGKGRYILWLFGLFYGHLVYVVAIWYNLKSFDIFSPVLVCCAKKNLASQVSCHRYRLIKEKAISHRICCKSATTIQFKEVIKSFVIKERKTFFVRTFAKGSDKVCSTRFFRLFIHQS
jgi:hypothetical protein